MNILNWLNCHKDKFIHPGWWCPGFLAHYSTDITASRKSSHPSVNEMELWPTFSLIHSTLAWCVLCGAEGLERVEGEVCQLVLPGKIPCWVPSKTTSSPLVWRCLPACLGNPTYHLVKSVNLSTFIHSLWIELWIEVMTGDVSPVAMFRLWVWIGYQVCFGSGMDLVRVLASYIEWIGYYRELKF